MKYIGEFASSEFIVLIDWISKYECKLILIDI